MVWFLLALCAAPSGHGAARARPTIAQVRPNIVFIMIDDLGWADLGCQGNRLIETPHIDRLASQGMRFTDAYAAAPVCSPTRAAALTGLSPARLRITTHIPDRPGFAPKDAKLKSAPTLDRLPLEHVTIAERLKAAGYATAFVGKWHLAGRGGAGDPAFYPERQGFDVNIGGCAMGGPPTFFDPYRIPTIENRRPGEYLPDRLAAEAVAFVKAQKDNPFLLCLWPYTVHWPMEAPEVLLKKYAPRRGRGIKDTRYAAMVEAMDAAVGRVVRAIDELGLGGRTLIIFTSDNGAFGGVADNRPLRAAKGYLYEGGIRVPLVVRWPGVVKPGSVSRTPVITTDFHPTILAAAGLELDPSRPCDGESLMPVLRGTGSLKRTALCFHFPNYAWHGDNRLGSAVREGDLKLIEYFDDGSVELYNLAEDIGETRDLSGALPEKAARLRRHLHRWRRETKAAEPSR
jgi:arylsulfatase A-like enzyme